MFRATQDSTRLQKVFIYRAITVYGSSFQSLLFTFFLATAWSYDPMSAETNMVWAVPRSLATTCGITFVFFSYGYLDVSVPHVRSFFQGDRSSTGRVAPFGYLRIKGYLHLPEAFRSLSRPSSPPRAKASTVCPCLLSFFKRHFSVGLIYL